MLPNFLVIGAMKAGTSSVYDYLRAHRQVFMSETKELRFFSGGSGGTWDRGLGWYEAQFEGAAAKGAVAIGEASPHYSMASVYPEAAPRIAEHLPDARLVYLVRDPIARIRSQYVHQWANGREARPLAEAALGDQAYVTNSSYHWQLERYLPAYAPDRILVVVSEQLRDDRAATMARILSFLGVDPELPAAAIAVERHRSADKRQRTAFSHRLHRVPLYRAARRAVPARLRRVARAVTTTEIDPTLLELPPDVESELRAQLAPDVARLKQLVGPGFDGWGIA